jgi:hypothetical protein
MAINRFCPGVQNHFFVNQFLKRSTIISHTENIVYIYRLYLKISCGFRIRRQ